MVDAKKLGEGIRKAGKHYADQTKKKTPAVPPKPAVSRPRQMAAQNAYNSTWEQMLKINAGNASALRSQSARKGISGKSAEYDPLSSASGLTSKAPKKRRTRKPLNQRTKYRRPSGPGGKGDT